jgi:hypothetical protein
MAAGVQGLVPAELDQAAEQGQAQGVLVVAAASTAGGAQPVWVPQSSITTRSPAKPRLPSLRSPWTRVEGRADSAAANGSGRASTASTGSATSAGTTSANRSQPRPISRGTSSAPRASRRAVAGERNR